jgi:hypothetical protein
LLKQTTSLPYRDIRAMRFTPDGKYILLVVPLSTLVVWDIAARAIVQELAFDLPELFLWSAHISDDCRVVHVSDLEGTSHVIHLTY